MYNTKTDIWLVSPCNSHKKYKKKLKEKHSPAPSPS